MLSVDEIQPSPQRPACDFVHRVDVTLPALETKRLFPTRQNLH